jgi:phosphoribosylformimino-5-aminoimidazole carboxamide ribonucleotide (ProFAR) isomerase
MRESRYRNANGSPYSLSRQFSSGIAGVIVGRALYERRFTLPEAL